MFFRLSIHVLLLLFSFKIHGQYQLSNNLLKLSPAFAGSKSGQRISSGFTIAVADTILGYKRGIYHYYGSYDLLVPAIRSGVGIYFNQGKLSNQTTGDLYDYTLTTIGLVVAPKFVNNVQRPTLTISPSGGLEYNRIGFVYGFPGNKVSRQNGTMAWRAGILLNADRLFIGAAFRRFTLNDVYYFFYQLHGGYVLLERNEISIAASANVIYARTGGNIMEDVSKGSLLYLEALNVNFRYRQLIVGTGLPSVMAGFQNDLVKVCVSYNLKYKRVNNLFEWNTALSTLQFSATCFIRNKARQG